MRRLFPNVYYRLLVFGKEPVAFLGIRCAKSVDLPADQGVRSSFLTMMSPYLLRKF